MMWSNANANIAARYAVFAIEKYTIKWNLNVMKHKTKIRLKKSLYKWIKV